MSQSQRRAIMTYDFLSPPSRFKPRLNLKNFRGRGAYLRGVLFIVRAGSDIIKADFMHTKRTNFPTKMEIGIHLEELK